jgi:phosphate transport system protein
MARESFHRELDRLVQEVVELGRGVESCLDPMVEAMKNWEAQTARRQVGIDSHYKERGAQIEEECLMLQARQAPVARDLRLVSSVQAVTNHVVRAGTLCEHICQAIAQSAQFEGDSEVTAILLEMAKAARSIFGEGLDVFEYREIDRAHDLEAADDEVDLLYAETMHLVVNPTKEGSGSPEWRAQAALVVHYLERIADHGVDIGGRTVFLVTGERMEEAMKQYRERRLEKPGE